jgi:hypothetical protein
VIPGASAATCPMSAYGCKADSLAHLSECPLIARSGHSHLLRAYEATA